MTTAAHVLMGIAGVLLFVAGLIAVSEGADPAWTPTVTVDRWFAAGPDVRGTSSSSVASGRHENRAGAYGEVPRPAETCRRMCSPQRDAPRARERSSPQLVTIAP